MTASVCRGLDVKITSAVLPQPYMSTAVDTPRPKSYVRRSDLYLYGGAARQPVHLTASRQRPSATANSSRMSGGDRRSDYGGAASQPVQLTASRHPPSATANSSQMTGGVVSSSVSNRQRRSDAIASGLASLRGSAEQSLQTFGTFGSVNCLISYLMS